MIRWGREVLRLLREINERLERIENNQVAIMRSTKTGRKFIATGQSNS